MVRDGFGREAIAEPLPAREVAPDEHPLRDWTARARGTALDALRYTRFVAFMKRVLPIAAAAVLASVIAYSFIPRHQEQDHMSLTYQHMGTIRNDLAMIRPKLTGADGKGNPFTITAAAAVQNAKNRRQATLEKVDADIQLDGAQWINASAAHGFFDMDAGTLKLDGGLSVYTDTGYELHTQSADVNLRQGIFKGQQKVTGQGPLGSLSADSFKIDRLKRRIVLRGHVQMTMYPKKVKR
ncbi:MAG: LPS export ABC transporter periplasmic protein LptC [Alphaproteobacteria bacterium]|nr:LPS export ABC transporter periplasmic protein LptC [Alphaproteobacteria bacterium]MDE1985609.1 LPS export ABC transporter periplasmic protein LptC [Alphaproteobacteria bacterium]MDE2162230.1 LPS export ABC transporter periplasmic protein LptC [Alphaproteobacteria bacterium]MDE2265770.1 LPS export ABC transporter periplasmic protein LptC [Alphaproteobacteria bacterium]MDE2499589.1 LPS export ABC transporter periplasmic protein LptC [Alphaproteobacteria bacterium]